MKTDVCNSNCRPQAPKALRRRAALGGLLLVVSGCPAAPQAAARIQTEELLRQQGPPMTAGGFDPLQVAAGVSTR